MSILAEVLLLVVLIETFTIWFLWCLYRSADEGRTYFIKEWARLRDAAHQPESKERDDGE